MTSLAIACALALLADPGAEPLVLGRGSLWSGATSSSAAVHPAGEREGLYSLVDGWRFHPGDDPSYAAPDFDDSDWTPAPLLRHEGTPTAWPGIGWFRIRLRTNASLEGERLGLAVFHVGAFELYLNGERLLGEGDLEQASRAKADLDQVPFGIASPVPFQAQTEAEYLLAIRYALPPDADLSIYALPFGCDMVVGDRAVAVGHLEQKAREALASFALLTGIVGTIALVHLLMFLFQPSSTQNLYFSLCCMGLVAVVYSSAADDFSESVGAVLRGGTALRLGLVTSAGFGTFAQYALFAPRTRARLRRLMVALVLALILALSVSLPWVFLGVILILLEQLRVVVRAELRKQRGARIAAAGCAAFAIGVTVQMFWSSVPDYTYAIGLVSMMFSFSILLARNFADTSKDLARELVERREHENSRRLLEIKTEHQAAQLQEAAKLAAAHRGLELANEELKRAQVQLVQSEKMASLGLLVAGIAHEVNTPIGAISSVRDSLQRAVDKLRKALAESHAGALETPAIATSLRVISESLKVIESGSARVATIVKRLKSFARLDESQEQTVDLHEGLDDTLLLVDHELRHGITVQKRYGALPKIVCHPSRLNQVFLNLIINARQAMGAHGTLTIETAVVGESVEVRISDTGPGISPEHLPRIFDPGFTTKGVGVGTGLGLSICYQIVADHAGSLRVSSEPPHGTTFVVALPIGPAAP